VGTPTDLTLRDAAAAVRDGAHTSVALTESALERARAVEDRVHAFITIDRDGALAAAAEIDRRRARGERLGPLAGVPVAVKDNLCTRGLRTTAGARILGTFVPAYDATVIERLRAADAVVLGKTNLDEFAMGSSTENSAYEPTRNPWNPTRVPGGSSGGSAAAVAARECLGALGSDTGGSIRLPASFCGVVGVKPTYGRVSRYGVIAYASSLDQVGTFGRTVEDAALLLDAIAGPDPRDATSSPRPAPSFALAARGDVRGLRLGMPREYFVEGMQPEVEASVREAVRHLESLGAAVVPVSLPHTSYAIATYYLIATAEASSNLARYDGVRYGLRVADAGASVSEMYQRSRAAGFGTEVKRRIVLGTYALSAGYYDAYYMKAQQARALITRDFEQAFASCDALVAPVAPTTAFPLGARTADPVTMYLSDVFTISVNLAGLPGLSVPCGFDADGLPIGLQLIGRRFDEATLLRVAAAHEAAAGIAGRHPSP